MNAKIKNGEGCPLGEGKQQERDREELQKGCLLSLGIPKQMKNKYQQENKDEKKGN